MKICFYPFKLKYNTYIDLMKKAASINDIEVYSVKTAFKNLKLFNEIGIFHINWYEGINSKKRVSSFIEYILKICIIKFLKLNRKKIVWTVHNKVQHNKKNSYLSMSLMKILCKNSDRIVIHSYESINVLENISKDGNIKNKIRYIEHPNYIGSYSKTMNNLRKELSIEENELVYLFVGQVSKYKNIEILIKAFNELKFSNSKLIIAGNPSSIEYKDELMCLVNNNKNIITYFKYVDDNEIISMLNTCDIVVLPYDLRSSLNSGTVFLAFSNSKTVISSRNGTILDLLEHNLCFSYDFKNDEEHYVKLKECLKQTYDLYCIDHKTISAIGKKAYDYVNKNNSLNIVAEKLNNLYNEII